MKKFNLFSLALAGLMLGACSENNDSFDAVDQGIEWNANGKGYVSMAIQLPTQSVSGTRANDNYDDGTPAEYAVNDATLILFVDDLVSSAYDMNLNFSPEGATANVTTTAKITQEINKTESDNIKALVVLNHNGLLTVENAVLKAGDTNLTGKTLSGLNDALKELDPNDSWHHAGLLMSNAVLSNAPGGANDPSAAAVAGPLVTIDASKIKPTRAEADANPAATIYVERAEAKITLNDKTNGTVTNGSNLTYEVNGWVLDNTNTTNKLVREVEGFDIWKVYTSARLTPAVDYRFIGQTSVSPISLPSYYRIYWGNDYNYTGSAVGQLTTIGGSESTISDDDLNSANGTTPAYCFENTTDLAGMVEQNLTRVIVKATFNGGTEFYTVDEDRSAIWLVEDVKKEVAARLLIDPVFNAWAVASVVEGQTLSSDTDFDVEFTNEAAGRRTVYSIVLNETGQGKLKSGAFETYPDNAVTLANSHITLDYYAGGASYYPVYIRHFDELQTPWAEDHFADGTVYGNNPTDYLGRYGVLRNNWYEINVNSIRSLGDPNVVEVTDEPVDKKESYISVQINVLAWAKRTQNVDL